jgi:hypothetical protein
MATTIKSTELDHGTIKNNLKTYFSSLDEFSDYDFEASGLSNILDVLAYNTHYNALVANFSLNEAYLGTAQLRPSVVSIAESLGYIPDSITTSRATVTLSITLPSSVTHPATIQINNGKTFAAAVDDQTYTFQTLEDLEGANDGTGFYQFKTLSGDQNILVYQGTLKSKTFLVGPYEENLVYVIPDPAMDIETATIKVYDSTTGTSYVTYTSILKAATIDANSRIYILKESPNGYFELTFGDGNTLGNTPQAGNKIVVEYLQSKSAAANAAKVFTPGTGIVVDGVTYALTTTTVSKSASGQDKETLESIRKNAPFQYATQNRMVTSKDYSALVLRNYSQLITDINAWGGEDNPSPKFGTTFLSIRFNADVSAATVLATKTSITSLAKDLGVISFDVDFTDPVYTYVEGDVFFRFNDKLTSFSKNTVESSVRTKVANYFTTAVGSFEQPFRRSNLLTDIDDVEVAVLSSRADIRLNQRLTPQLSAKRDYTLTFPSPISIPDDVNYIISSTNFVYAGKTCKIQNRLSTSILEVIDVTSQDVLIDNLGEYTTAGVVKIVGFTPTTITSGDTYIKIVVTPSNQSAVEPVRNDILLYDDTRTVVRAVTTTSTT